MHLCETVKHVHYIINLDREPQRRRVNVLHTILAHIDVIPTAISVYFLPLFVAVAVTVAVNYMICLPGGVSLREWRCLQVNSFVINVQCCAVPSWVVLGCPGLFWVALTLCYKNK